MISTAERFWIAFILRFAFGFLFLFAALNIFNYGTEKFAKDLSTPMAATWLGGVEAKIVSLWNPEVEFHEAKGDIAITYFLKAMPWIMTGLAVCILTGILLKTALRVGALLLVMLGLGKYLQNDVATTAADFSFALMICIGLYFLGLPKRRREAYDDGAGEAPAY